MGREVRRVPANWKHPKKQGSYVPMHEHFPYNAEEIQEGLRDGWLKGRGPNYGIRVMPQWPTAKRTHLQMYEDCTEGTPISPVMATEEELARWLTDHGASAFAGMTASYEAWLATIRSGGSISAVVCDGRLESGVEANLRLKHANADFRRGGPEGDNNTQSDPPSPARNG